jgi:hypothetical protein
VGINFESSDSACDISLYTEFETRRALDAYQTHSEHRKLREFMPLIRTERRVVDYEV